MKVMLILFVWLATAFIAVADPCLFSENGKEKEKAIYQITADKCACCVMLPAFLQQHKYTYILFYSQVGRLNADISTKFEELADRWKHTKIAFGKIDVDADREMSKEWVDSDYVPTNVMFAGGSPLEVKPADFKKLRDEYQGSWEGQIWLLNKYMGEHEESGPNGEKIKADGSNIHYVIPLKTKKKFNAFIKKHEIALVAFLENEFDEEIGMLRKAVYEIHEEFNEEDLTRGNFGVVLLDTMKKLDREEIPLIELYIDGKLQKTLDADKEWTLKLVKEFMLSGLSLDPEKSGREEL